MVTPIATTVSPAESLSSSLSGKNGVSAAVKISISVRNMIPTKEINEQYTKQQSRSFIYGVL